MQSLLCSVVIAVMIFLIHSSVLSYPYNMTTDLTTDDFQNRAVLLTNQCRFKSVNTSNVTYGSNLLPICKGRIQSLINCSFSSETCGGINLLANQQNYYYMPPGSPTMPTIDNAVLSFYDEVSRYIWSKPGYSSNYAHFTNMVWASVKTIACCQSGNTVTKETVIVCLYSPGGNLAYVSSFVANVLPLKS